MNFRQISQRAGLILALTLPILGSAPTVSSAAESPALVRSQPDSSSVRPGPGSVSPQSVNSNPAGGLSPTPTATASVTRHGPRAASVGTLDVETAPDGRPARAGSLIVTFRKGAGPLTQSEAHTQFGAASVEAVSKTNAVRVQVTNGTLGEAMAAYASRPDVARVEPD